MNVHNSTGTSAATRFIVKIIITFFERKGVHKYFFSTNDVFNFHIVQNNSDTALELLIFLTTFTICMGFSETLPTFWTNFPMTSSSLSGFLQWQYGVSHLECITWPLVRVTKISTYMLSKDGILSSGVWIIVFDKRSVKFSLHLFVSSNEEGVTTPSIRAEHAVNWNECRASCSVSGIGRSIYFDFGATMSICRICRDGIWPKSSIRRLCAAKAASIPQCIPRWHGKRLIATSWSCRMTSLWSQMFSRSISGRKSLKYAGKPDGMSRISGFPSIPMFASSAASNPNRAAFPACNGFVVVPAFAIGAPANDAAMAMAWRHFCGPSPSNLATAAELPITPTIAGGCSLQIYLARTVIEPYHSAYVERS